MLYLTLFFALIAHSANTYSASFPKKVPFGHITKQYIADFLPSNPIVVEAGAADGADSAAMADLWPQGIIYAFEPVPELFAQLQYRVRKKQNVVIYPFALGKTSEVGNIYVSTCQGAVCHSSSLYEPQEHITSYPTIDFQRTVPIQIYTLDDWAREHNVSQVDFLWLDMQGGEFDMLKASPTILSTVSVIFTEVSHRKMYKDTPLYEEFKAWLEKEGFRAIILESDGLMGNVLFIRKELFAKFYKKLAQEQLPKKPSCKRYKKSPSI